MPRNETYLGDGLYASHDGFQLRLRAPRDGGDHEVIMDAETLRAFLQFLDTLPRMRGDLDDAAL
jgi:hypothetical protein